MQKLSGKEIDTLITVLLEAFPDPGEMEMLLRTQLDQNMRAITNSGSYRLDLFRLIEQAEAKGWTEALLQACRQSNPGNQALAEFVETALARDPVEISVEVDPAPRVRRPVTSSLNASRLVRSLYLADPPLQGADVQQLQRRLLELGFTEVGPADGIFGSRTEAAVRSYQRANGLPADAIVGPMTWTSLFPG
jgi:peptidoglycan hydrolase-like protein with peptidoglycan-binding domain